MILNKWISYESNKGYKTTIAQKRAKSVCLLGLNIVLLLPAHTRIQCIYIV